MKLTFFRDFCWTWNSFLQTIPLCCVHQSDYLVLQDRVVAIFEIGGQLYNLDAPDSFLYKTQCVLIKYRQLHSGRGIS